ncbi:MAG TPA: long-chain fatty acid--CoA ligase [Dermatophilaceae bacterium]|nr:long-chain fatty acid--CoA ligase [Dermatophilaceae bacterium]
MSTVTAELDKVSDRPPSFGRMFLDRVAKNPDREAYRWPMGSTWESMTWSEAQQRVEAVAAGLVALGIEPEERVAIISSTRLEWILADFGIMCAGAATTTVYPTTIPEDVAYILSDSQTRVAFAEDDTQLAKLRAHRGELPDLMKVVTFDGTPDGDWVISLDELARAGEERLVQDSQVVLARVDATKPDQLATLIYTSGTTGRPKGVRLSHDCWVYEGVAVEALELLTHDDVQYLWLPLSHSFGKVLLSAQLASGSSIAVDGRVDKIVENLAVVRPTFMAAAPRIFEKVRGRVVTMAEEEGGVRLKIFRWAMDVGRDVSRLKLAGQQPGAMLKAKHAVADKLVFSKLQARFGGRLRFFVSGSAALSTEVAEFFHAAGILILEGYGLTETSAGTFVNRPNLYKFGTVGPPMPGTEVRIAEDGEIMVRGPGVMQGYHQLPEQTAEALEPDGWLHTGDIGELDADNYLRITDRKKDLIKTSGGKYVAPQAIEVLFKGRCALASQIVVHGDGRNYVTALVTLDPDAVSAWAAHRNVEADYASLTRHEEIRAEIERAIEHVNSVVNRWETIKDYRILDRDLTVEEGDLTPSLKVKRRVVEQRHKPLFDEMYPNS